MIEGVEENHRGGLGISRGENTECRASNPRVNAVRPTREIRIPLGMVVRGGESEGRRPSAEHQGEMEQVHSRRWPTGRSQRGPKKGYWLVSEWEARAMTAEKDAA